MTKIPYIFIIKLITILDLSQSDVHVTGLSKNQENSKFYKEREKSPSKELSEPSRNLKNGNSECKVRDLNDNSHEKCFIFTNIGLNMNDNSTNVRDTRCVGPNKVDFATSIVTYTSCQDSTQLLPTAISKLNKRLDHLERKVLRQDMVIRSFSPNLHLSSSDEETKESMMRSNSASGRPGCSYIQQYSHIPETSAFQRYAHQTPLSPSKATTLEKEHNSEQYGRDFTTYDGITARGRRQCASVPCKRDDAPRLAAERVHKIRHKLNPVRDYRLMDTVHYLAQGEFAPRDDGIKLTPSREAVLSDIIYEDVCRTHWPNTRLGRRQHPERCSERCTTRGELQRLIDSLLRERVAHVERRKRRHYRIVKLNHRHENCRPAVGKTGDIIVASHKNRQTSEDMIANDQNRGSEIVSDKRRLDESSHKYPKSHDKLGTSDLHHKNRIRIDECSPGPSNTVRSTSNREPTCCYRTSNAAKSDKHYDEPCNDMCFHKESSSKPQVKNPRLIIKKEAVRRGHSSREESNLEHYVLLPTLVVRTPSNMKRQKKFNELYHRILSNGMMIFLIHTI